MFEIDGKKQKIEEFVYVYYNNRAKLQEIESAFFTLIKESSDSLQESTSKSTVKIPKIKSLDISL
jgi:hypothetical protein